MLIWRSLLCVFAFAAITLSHVEAARFQGSVGTSDFSIMGVFCFDNSHEENNHIGKVTFKLTRTDGEEKNAREARIVMYDDEDDSWPKVCMSVYECNGLCDGICIAWSVGIWNSHSYPLSYTHSHTHTHSLTHSRRFTHTHLAASAT
jgi:hypothetical protein